VAFGWRVQPLQQTAIDSTPSIKNERRNLMGALKDIRKSRSAISEVKMDERREDSIVCVELCMTTRESRRSARKGQQEGSTKCMVESETRR
jgi:hypothetical protein